MIDYKKIKPLLFKMDPERAHGVAEAYLRMLSSISPLKKSYIKSNFIDDEMLKQRLFDVEFANPVGLAAGFDKNATMIEAAQALGFGFSEIGTITPRPQKGNPKPRMFRHIEQKSLQNAMGFNNDGSYAVARRLKKASPTPIPIGINIGKNKDTTELDAIQDYSNLLKSLRSYGNYIVINISSPNTPGLRDLQNEQFIEALFKEAKSITTKPILLKIAPDMSCDQAVELSKMALKHGSDGIIATNTTVDYSLVTKPYSIGGLSGEVLKDKSFEIFDAIASELFGKTTLISVGGIDSAEEAYRRIKAGASLIQIYTALVYGGETLIGDINRGLIELLKVDGYTNITEAIGANRS